MNRRSLHHVHVRRSSFPGWMLASLAVAALGLFGALLPATAGAAPQTRDGFFMGLGLGAGSMGLSADGESSDRLSGSSGSFRLGYAINPKFALGVESGNWFKSEGGELLDVGTFTAAASFFPAEGLVLRGGFGVGVIGGADEGISGEVGTGMSVGAAYEFRATKTLAIGPQLDYGRVHLEFVDFDYVNLALVMNWYFGSK